MDVGLDNQVGGGGEELDVAGRLVAPDVDGAAGQGDLEQVGKVAHVAVRLGKVEQADAVGVQQGVDHRRLRCAHHEEGVHVAALEGVDGRHAAEGDEAWIVGGHAVGGEQLQRKKLGAAAGLADGDFQALELVEAIELGLAPVEHPYGLEIHAAEGGEIFRFRLVGNAALDEADVHAVVGLEAEQVFDGAC